VLATFPRFRELERRYGSLTRGMLAARRTRPASHSAGAAPASRAGAHADSSGTTAGAITSGAPVASAAIPRTIFLSFKDGTAELTNELAARVAPLTRLGVKVARIERAGAALAGSVHQAGAYRLALQTPRGGDACEADAVVAAVPADVAAGLLGKLAPSAATELKTIRYVDTGVVSLAYRAEDVPARYGFGVLVPRSERRPINAITLSSVKFNGRAPAGYALLRVFFGGSRSPQSMHLDDRELLATVHSQLTELLGVNKPPLFERIYRWWQANPQYDVGHLDLVERVRAGLPEGVFVTGSPYTGVGLPDCVRQARETALQVLEALPCR
jgi:oxygen-dependent protoporphyrinogen oxidase